MKITIIMGFILLFLSCKQTTQKTLDIKVETYMSNQEQIDDFIDFIIRDIGKLPKKANHLTKSDSIYNDHYAKLVHQHDLMFYYSSKEKKDTIYFAVNRITPSLYGKKVALGGKLLLSENKEIAYLEEVFRTYKMPLDELENKTEMLFLKMINGENLTVYEFKNSQPEEYIEFPDEYTSYNIEKRKWETTREIYFEK